MPSETAEQKRQRAQAQFKKAEQRARESASVFDELRRKSEAAAANMARLRALRLARDAEAPAAQPEEPPPVPRKSARKKKPESADAL